MTYYVLCSPEFSPQITGTGTDPGFTTSKRPRSHRPNAVTGTLLGSSFNWPLTVKPVTTVDVEGPANQDCFLERAERKKAVSRATCY